MRKPESIIADIVSFRIKTSGNIIIVHYYRWGSIDGISLTYAEMPKHERLRNIFDITPIIDKILHFHFHWWLPMWHCSRQMWEDADTWCMMTEILLSPRHWCRKATLDIWCHLTFHTYYHFRRHFTPSFRKTLCMTFHISMAMKTLSRHFRNIIWW